jgi:hypothetical protein
MIVARMAVQSNAPTAKATGFISAVSAIRSLCTPSDFAAVVRALPPDTAALVERPPLPLEWMPTRHFTELVVAAHRIAFAGDDDKVIQAASRAMRNDLKTIYRVFIRFMSPGYVIERGAKLFDTYNRDNGALTVARTSESSAEITYRGILNANPTVWLYHRGAIHGVLEAMGYKSFSVTVQSGGGDTSSCVLVAEWE